MNTCAATLKVIETKCLYARNALLTNSDPLGLDWLYINGVKAADVSSNADDGLFSEMKIRRRIRWLSKYANYWNYSLIH